ncbi:MAG: hypothetical protein HKL90_14710 [Elusimicrobia bacterium]|nr:hypothetical protein [Elusimicrobiota bacterium]
MQFIESNEIAAWCKEHGIALSKDYQPLPDAALIHQSRVVYANGKRSGQESKIALRCVRALGDWQECLLLVTGWGIWGSGEDWPTYYAARGKRGERRSIEQAPGHLFGENDGEELSEFLTLVLENGWDAYLLEVPKEKAKMVRLQVSHDEWVEARSSEAISL